MLTRAVARDWARAPGQRERQRVRGGTAWAWFPPVLSLWSLPHRRIERPAPRPQVLGLVQGRNEAPGATRFFCMWIWTPPSGAQEQLSVPPGGTAPSARRWNRGTSLMIKSRLRLQGLRLEKEVLNKVSVGWGFVFPTVLGRFYSLRKASLCWKMPSSLPE